MRRHGDILALITAKSCEKLPILLFFGNSAAGAKKMFYSP